VLFFYYTSFKEFLFQPITTTQVTVFFPPQSKQSQSYRHASRSYFLTLLPHDYLK